MNPEIHDYKLIRGLPGEVELRVEELIRLCDGWEPKGDPMVFKTDKHDIIVQCMIRQDW